MKVPEPAPQVLGPEPTVLGRLTDAGQQHVTTSSRIHSWEMDDIRRHTGTGFEEEHAGTSWLLNAPSTFSPLYVPFLNSVFQTGILTGQSDI